MFYPGLHWGRNIDKFLKKILVWNEEVAKYIFIKLNQINLQKQKRCFL